MFYEIIKYLASFITPTNCKEESKKTSELKYSTTDVGDNTQHNNEYTVTINEDDEGGPIWF